MPRIYDDINAKCPFYLQSGKKTVMCEGITCECRLHVLFDSEEVRNRHRRIFCDAAFRNCEIFEMLEKKYE